MGCSETKDANTPVLVCIIEPNNETQKAYCLQVKDNIKPTKPVKYEIKSYPNSTFSINLKIRNELKNIESFYDESQIDTTINSIHTLLNGTN